MYIEETGINTEEMSKRLEISKSNLRKWCLELEATMFAKRYKLSMLTGVFIINFILHEHLGSEGMGEAKYSIGYRYIITGLILFPISILANYLNKRKVA